MSAHTPGPWRLGVNQLGGTHVVSEEHGLICETPGGGYCGLQLNDAGKAHSSANAKLIAAAPDLVEALKDCRQAINMGSGHEKILALHHADLAAIAALDKAGAL